MPLKLQNLNLLRVDKVGRNDPAPVEAVKNIKNAAES